MEGSRHFAIVICLCGALAMLAGCSGRARPGHPVPDFQLTLLDGRKVTLASYRGRVLVLNFWASWCPPCIEETPALNRLAQDFPEGKVVVLGVSIDEDPVAYRTFLARFHIGYPTARDPSQDLMHRYGTRQIPETYIIGPDGRLARKLVSVADWTAPAMVEYIRNLAERSSPGEQRSDPTTAVVRAARSAGR